MTLRLREHPPLVLILLLVMCAMLVPVRAHGTPEHDRDVALQSAGRCGSCHPAELRQHQESVHAGEHVGCVACHGGDAQASEQAAAHGNGFKGKLTRDAVPALCASCHADTKAMRAYGIPTDQYALWQQGAHGLKFRAGDAKSAVCSDCHGAHDIRSPRDPAARTHVLNVAATCAKCHSDAALLASRKLDDTGAEFAKSAHARALVQHGGEGAPTCTTCHGVHGADAPDAGEVDKMCGRCHGAERSAFLAGPHANALHQAGREACSACHGDHQSHEPGDAVSPAQCASCHAPMSQGALVGRRIGREWAAAERELAEAEKRVARASRVPLNTEDHEQRLDEVRQHLAEARTAVHTATWEAAEEPLRQARTVTREVERDLEGRLNVLYMWRILLAVFVFYVIGTATLLRRMRDRGSRDAG
jgi:hypothetical protein